MKVPKKKRRYDMRTKEGKQNKFYWIMESLIRDLRNLANRFEEAVKK